MKLFSATAAAVIIGASLVTAAPAKARNGYIYIGKFDGVRLYAHDIKRHQYDGNSLKFLSLEMIDDNKNSIDTARVAINCTDWTHMFLVTNGRKTNKDQFRRTPPQSVADAVSSKVCL
jgi:hypothetical protein